MNNLNRKNDLYNDLKMIILQHQLSYLKSELKKHQKELEDIKKRARINLVFFIHFIPNVFYFLFSFNLISFKYNSIICLYRVCNSLHYYCII